MEQNKTPMLFPFAPEEVWQKIREIVRNEIQAAKETKTAVTHEVPGMVQKPLYKAVEVCTMLSISRQTLYLWVKEGILKAYKIKSRTFFLTSDIEQLMQLKKPL